MEQRIAEAIGVVAICTVIGIYLYFKHTERRRRLEIIHQERLAAMDKGIPLPELPLDQPKVAQPTDPRDLLLHGLVWAALGLGGVVTMAVIGPMPNGTPTWPMPLPLVFLGAGLMLYYVLASERAR